MDFKSMVFSTLPPQKISEKEKDQQWKEQCVDAVCSMGNMRNPNGRTTTQEKQIKYDIVNSIINQNDFNYVLNPYGIKDKNIQNTPAKLRDINIIANKINTLKGEELNRPFDFNVIGINGEILTEKDRKKNEQLRQMAYMKLAQELGISLEPQVDPNTGQEIPPPTFPNIDKYAGYSEQDEREEWGNIILQDLIYSLNVPFRFNEGWEHGLIVAEEYYYVGIVNKKPVLRACNPLYCEFNRNPNNPNIEDGDWFREDRWLTKGQILDEFGEVLTDDQVEKLDNGQFGSNFSSNQMFPGYAYSQTDINKYESGFNRTSRFNSNHYLVTHVCWKSMKKIGFLSFTDELGEPQEGIVDENFKLTPDLKKAGYTIDWRWIPEVWHGTKIGTDFYANIEPVPNQIRSMDDPYSVKLPYIGRIYNSTNTKQTSLVDLIKPHQYLYNIVWYRLENELAKAKGKKMVMDIAQIPKSQGIDLEKWMYFFDNIGLALINSFEEGTGKFQGQVSNFNQFSNIDMGLSQAVGQYIGILTKIEQLVDKIVGITPQREGNVHQSETATATQAAIVNSTNITEPWFYIHNEIKKNVLTHLLECAKLAYPKLKKINYIANDFQRIYAEIDMDKFCDSDYAVYVTNSTNEHKIFNKLEGLAQQAMASGVATFSNIVDMFKAKSTSELSRLIKTSEREKQERDQQQLETQKQMQTEQLQAAAEEKQKERDFVAEQAELDREAKIHEAVIKGMGFDQDTQGNQMNDAINYGAQVLKEMEANNKQRNEENKHTLEQRKLGIEEKRLNQEKELKHKELQSKERIEQLKARTALKNKTSGEK